MSRRRVLFFVLAALLAVAATAGVAVAGKRHAKKKTLTYAIGLWGDLP